MSLTPGPSPVERGEKNRAISGGEGRKKPAISRIEGRKKDPAGYDIRRVRNITPKNRDKYNRHF